MNDIETFNKPGIENHVDKILLDQSNVIKWKLLQELQLQIPRWPTLFRGNIEKKKTCPVSLKGQTPSCKKLLIPGGK